MHLYLGVVIFSFVLTMVLLVPFIGQLYKWKFTRRDESRSLTAGDTQAYREMVAKHNVKAGTPTGGGILLVCLVMGIFLALAAILGFFRVEVIAGYPVGWEVGVLFFTWVGFGFLGLYDDIIKIFRYKRTGFFGLRVRQKFIIQWAIGLGAAGMLYFGLGINFINVPGWGIVGLGWGYFLLAAFLIVAFANAFDITSGLDGLGEGLLLICLLAFWVIAAAKLDSVLSLFLAVWIGALVAGTYFTVNPARTFLGNTSGMAFGATLAVVGLLSGKIVALLVIGGVIVVDGASSLLQILSFKLFRKRIFTIAPLHHWLEIIGWEEPKIVARAWLVGIVMAIFGVWLAML